MSVSPAKHARVRLHQQLRPRKSLGQNFLRDQNILRKIVRAIDPQPTDAMIEIGPGEGALTQHLNSKVGWLVAVDVDRRSVERVREAFPRVETVHNDFLKFDIENIARHYGGMIRIVGNIPYNITSPILFHILDHRAFIRDAVLMVQKEVALRLVAGPGTKDYGILSIFFQVFTDVELLFDVSPNAFFPRPDVTSSVIRLTMVESPRHEISNEKAFRGMVRSVFAKRRKMLRGSMKYFCDEHGYEIPRDFDLTRRPEDLTIRELVHLSNALVQARVN